MLLINKLPEYSTEEKRILLRRRGKFSTWEDNDYRVYWEGLLFVNGVLSGEESIKSFLKELRKTDIRESCRTLKGIFFILVEEKTTGDHYAFVDNSGLYQAFYTDNNISNSFLEIIKQEKYSVEDFDPYAVFEFLYFGYLFSSRTFFSSIKRIPGDEILHLSHQDAKMHKLQKNILSLGAHLRDNAKSFHKNFEGLAISLSNRKVSIDLTGGVDSRLTAVMLDSFGLGFETATSGGTIDYEDVLISKEVANALGHPWYSTIHSETSLEEDMSELFYVTEGLYDILYYHRLFQLQKERAKRGVDTIILGTGGELFKDHWWLQDFPFYYKRFANLERLVDMRIMIFKPIQYLLTKEYSQIIHSLRSKIIQDVSQYSLETNTKTYDNIFFNYISRDIGGRGFTNNSYFVQCYAPYLDLDISRIGFNLSRIMRFFNLFHRKELTRINPVIARIPTTESGVSASSEIGCIMRDIPLLFRDRLKRFLLKLRKQNKSFKTLNNPNFYSHVREMKVMIESIENLKDNGFVNKDVEIEQVENNRLGAFLSLSMLINYMKE